MKCPSTSPIKYRQTLSFRSTTRNDNQQFFNVSQIKKRATKPLLFLGSEVLPRRRLDTILRYSVKFGNPKLPKRGIKNQEIYTLMQEMRYELVGIGEVKNISGNYVFSNNGVFLQFNCEIEKENNYFGNLNNLLQKKVWSCRFWYIPLHLKLTTIK